MKGRVIWITGLPGAGKTTLANQLVSLLQPYHPVLLDGDSLRAALNDQDYSAQGRKKLSLQYAGLANMLAEQGHLVVVSVVAMYHEVHLWNRENNKLYTEVLLKPSQRTLSHRNKKGLYQPGGAFESLDSAKNELAIEYPLHPDYIFDSGNTHPQDLAKKLLDSITLKSQGKIGHAG
ncbi:adenylyl-sulfate kinase [Agarivorans sp. MS3-6]|uniref:adenylyl-sulfate kinase n=1 Tax=Agarivorans sp. TSD2052 TaxID=2937286 RepID=UPI0020105B59|nr:adenylyl-sulfate kinase [Agarivorans sp. TSD2052]UPW20173.1 adenylyl-sulfate kinase [Agarivorans sp. TSD2052]